ncbi:DUF2946 family protein [Qipengyuania qiaonensis]|uniref:DUF2946 domain-containing protein n=1 Tax=Qipengyuania qiaonensis TaxID=2867240 RepID=A0ABS7J8B6_9SPHN|nr:DUF2946 family protein [Qipengyuania qiaonensis]MBX7483560.1 hypothetical protein [Qipengyuania qiaonensis]
MALTGAAMGKLRAFARQHAFVGTLFLMAVLLLKAAVPAGYMVSASSEKLIEVSICHGTTGERSAAFISIPFEEDRTGKDSSQDKKEPKCAFSALAQHATGGASAELLATALAAILVLGLAPLAVLSSAPARFLRPPLRGPPSAI